MKLLRAIAITCFASFFAIIAYGQGEVVDLDKMELLAENCESDGEGACHDVLTVSMDQVEAAQDSNLMEPMECPEVGQKHKSNVVYCKDNDLRDYKSLGLKNLRQLRGGHISAIEKHLIKE